MNWLWLIPIAVVALIGLIALAWMSRDDFDDE